MPHHNVVCGVKWGVLRIWLKHCRTSPTVMPSIRLSDRVTLLRLGAGAVGGGGSNVLFFFAKESWNGFIFTVDPSVIFQNKKKLIGRRMPFFYFFGKSLF